MKCCSEIFVGETNNFKCNLKKTNLACFIRFYGWNLLPTDICQHCSLLFGMHGR